MSQTMQVVARSTTWLRMVCAARFGPDLTSTERFTLLRDSITRLQNAPGGPVRIRDVKDLLYIQHR